MAQSSSNKVAPTSAKPQANRRQPLWVILVACLATASLSFVAMSAIFGHNQASETSTSKPPVLALATHTPPASWPTPTPDPATVNFPRISVATLKQLLDQKADVQLLDNSSDDEYAKAHIVGAIHFQLQDLTVHQSELDASKPVILYCNCTAEQVSISFGRALQVRGFSDVRALSGGLKAWQQAGYATASGSQ